MNPPSFSRIAVTGASGALGRALLQASATSGLQVAAFHRRGPCPQLAAWSTSVDLADPSATTAAFARMESEWGTPHALIHCAGAGVSELFARSQPETWEALLNANLRSALHAARAVIPGMMRQGGGSILFVGSLAALRPRPGQAVYAAAKGALESLTRALARELAPKAIRVNTLAPGFLDTPMVRALPPATQAALLDTIPLGRLGTVDEIARACLFWASPQSAYTTGQVIRIDGGASC